MKKTPIELARERHAAKRVVEEKEKQMTSRKVPQPATHEHWRVGFSTSSSGYRHPVFARYSGVGDHAQDSTHNVTELTISTPITSFTPINQPAQATGDSLEDAIVID